jgi:hypothetical protein
VGSYDVSVNIIMRQAQNVKNPTKTTKPHKNDKTDFARASRHAAAGLLNVRNRRAVPLCTAPSRICVFSHLPQRGLLRQVSVRKAVSTVGQKLAAIADGADDDSKAPRKRQATSLQPGTRLLCDWRGQRYEVIVQEDGFLHDGKKYRSLSAVARAITGSYWSGNRFFGLTPNSKKEGRGA